MSREVERTASAAGAEFLVDVGIDALDKLFGRNSAPTTEEIVRAVLGAVLAEVANAWLAFDGQDVGEV